MTLETQTATTSSTEPGARRRRGVWGALTGAVATVMGLLPHVLHHVGPLVGAALLTGAAGTTIFGLAGLALSVPMLLRLRRRFGSWWAPAIGLVAFTGLFLFSSLVVGPLISNPGESTVSVDEHAAHHD